MTGLDTRLLAERDTIRAVLGRQWWQAILLAAGRLGLDYGCLLCALRATGANPQPSLVLLAYAAAGIIGLFPITSGWAFAGFIAAFVCLIAMNFTVRRSASASVALLFAFGLLMGLAMSPTLVYYASVNPQALWQAGGATALFIAACGGIGFATRRDLSGLARASFWAPVALILFGVVMIFVHIPGGSLAYSIIRLVIFAGLTMSDFQRLRRSTDIDSAPLMAASIFLDVLNVFLFFLRLFSRNR